MNWTIVAVGKPKLAYARDGIIEYETRLRPLVRLDLICVPASHAATEGEALLRRSPSSAV